MLSEASKRLFVMTTGMPLIGVLCVAALTWVPAAGEEGVKAADLASRLAKMDLGLAIKGVNPSEVPGLFEVLTDGGLLYVTGDARHLIAGSIYEIRDGDLVNLTERRRAYERRELLAGIDPADFITFTPEDGAQATVTVFTDTDCGYCRRLHGKMPEYHANGIEVRYLAYPRTGVGSPTYDKMVAAWCSDDARGAMDALKRGEGIPEGYCETHPVSEQFELGQLMGITGTPAILLPSGQMLPGYVPPDDLAELLGL